MTVVSELPQQLPAPTRPADGAAVKAVLHGIGESVVNGHVVLRPVAGSASRRVLYVNSYGGPSLWGKVKRGEMPPHHLWGCLELARIGYEVALAEPLRHFCLYRNPLPHDLKLLRAAHHWLGRDGIVYCGHTLLYWLPLLSRLGGLRCRLVSLTFARETLDFAKAHSGIIGLTPAAADQARMMAPRVAVAHLGWGADLDHLPRLEYRPENFFSCGITGRDFHTLSAAAARTRRQLRVICPGLPAGVTWPANVSLVDGGTGWNFQKSVVSYRALLHEYYARCAASLIILRKDQHETTANGLTNLIEAMAMARPVIVTRTNALARELDVEKAGCGLHVPPEDPEALASAIESLAVDPARAQAMGERGRQLVESHYNIGRYARDLHSFFESLG